MEKYLFWGAFFFAYLINGITGFAGNIFAMPVGMSTIGHETSIAVLNCNRPSCKHHDRRHQF